MFSFLLFPSLSSLLLATTPSQSFYGINCSLKSIFKKVYPMAFLKVIQTCTWPKKNCMLNLCMFPETERLFFLSPLHETFKQVGNRCRMPGTHCTPNILVRSCSLWGEHFISKSQWTPPVLGQSLTGYTLGDEKEFYWDMDGILSPNTWGGSW